MDFIVKSGNPAKQRSACVAVGVFESRRLSAAAAQIDHVSGGHLTALLRRGDMEGRLGQTLLLTHVPEVLCDRVLLVGCGRERDFGDSAYRKVAAAAARELQQGGAAEAVSYLPDLSVKGGEVGWRVRDAVQTTIDTLYRFDRFKSKQDTPRRPLRKLTLAVPSRAELGAGEAAARIGEAIGKGMGLAKDLGNLPGNLCTPAYLAERADELAQRFEKVSCETLGPERMEELGMGALLSVARGSRQEPRLIVLHYRGGAKSARCHALVGKGVTFDTGGISIKPAAAMDEMKYDMCGAASVLGTVQAAAELELPINLVGVVAAVENMPDGNASRPGDIVTSMSGQTIEILNTDAEGRLALCDALTYVERFEPESVIDIATLTGACIIALGHEAQAVLGNNTSLINDLLAAGRLTGDRCWELPLFEEYQEQPKSNSADMANVGGRAAGTITAACFLSRYAKKYRWAHLDIAGTAWRSGDQKGGTGRPVPLLTQYLIEHSEKS